MPEILLNILAFHTDFGLAWELDYTIIDFCWG